MTRSKTNKREFNLRSIDSEGGDYPRIYSIHHQSEFFIHKDSEIEFIDYVELKQYGKGYLVYKLENGLKDKPFFIFENNAEWSCNECGDCYKSYERPQTCELCDEYESEEQNL